MKAFILIYIAINTTLISFIMYQFCIMKRIKVYLSGKISGEVYEECLEKFEFAKEQIEKQLGYNVVTPFDVLRKNRKKYYSIKDEDEKYYFILKKDIIEMLKCDGVIFLADWEESNGAKIEKSVCDLVKIETSSFLI